jgi:hypothetical protein
MLLTMEYAAAADHTTIGARNQQVTSERLERPGLKMSA